MEKQTMKYSDPKHFDRKMQQLANDLGITKQEVLERPMIEIAGLMADKGVSIGMQVVK